MLLTRRLNLRDDERVVTIVRRSILAYATPIAFAVASIFLAFFLVTPLFARGTFGSFVFLVLLAAGIAAAARTTWMWYWNAFVITNTRVIDVDQRGFFHRGISDARYEKIEDIAVEIRGMLATLFHLGTIRLQTAGAHARIELATVPRPELVQELLGRLQQEAAGSSRESVAPDHDLTNLADDALVQLRERIEVELRLRQSRKQ